MEQVALLVVLIIFFSLIMEPLQLGMVRVYEGYWGSLVDFQKIEAIGRVNQWKNFQKDKNIDHYPPEYDYFLPTSFGNRLRAVEFTAGNRFGLDTVFFWPAPISSSS